MLVFVVQQLVLVLFVSVRQIVVLVTPSFFFFAVFQALRLYSISSPFTSASRSGTLLFLF